MTQRKSQSKWKTVGLSLVFESLDQDCLVQTQSADVTVDVVTRWFWFWSRPQHLSGLQLVSDLCSGSLQGASIGSTDVNLNPGKVRGGNHTADTQTAG